MTPYDLARRAELAAKKADQLGFSNLRDAFLNIADEILTKQENEQKIIHIVVSD